MVGFQTKLKHGAQTEDLPDDPGPGEGGVRRLGGLHRNTFLNSPSCSTAPCA
jgi:NAD(FAD)-utilizing enzyme possibly involved in translation